MDALYDFYVHRGDALIDDILELINTIFRIPTVRFIPDLCTMLEIIEMYTFELMTKMVEFIWRHRYNDIVYLPFSGRNHEYIRTEIYSILRSIIQRILKVIERVKVILGMLRLPYASFIAELRKMFDYVNSITCCFIVYSEEDPPRNIGRRTVLFEKNRNNYRRHSLIGRCPLWLINSVSMQHRITEETTVKSIVEDFDESYCPVCRTAEINENAHFVILNCCRHLFCVFCAETLFCIATSDYDNKIR